MFYSVFYNPPVKDVTMSYRQASKIQTNNMAGYKLNLLQSGFESWFDVIKAKNQASVNDPTVPYYPHAVRLSLLLTHLQHSF